MKWARVLEAGLLECGSECRLIVVGETKDGQPFCYEDRFTVQKIGPDTLVAGLAYHTIHPLEKLHHIGFVELSFRHRGMLYYTFVDFVQLESTKQQCVLTLSAPDTVQVGERRSAPRIPLPSRIPITCRIVGVRGEKSPQTVVFHGQMIELSAGGVAFITTARLIEALLLELTFLLPPSSDMLTVTCEVVRVGPFGSDSYRIAAKIVSCPSETADRLHRYCQAAERQQEAGPQSGARSSRSPSSMPNT